jgi:hypothetical protein
MPGLEQRSGIPFLAVVLRRQLNLREIKLLRLSAPPLSPDDDSCHALRAPGCVLSI